MNNDIKKRAEQIKCNIENSKLTIYDPLTPQDEKYWYSDAELEFILKEYMLGKSYIGQATKTRSKSINQDICRALGYPIPSTFRRTRPRFLGQNFDKYAQQKNNLQIWNEEVSLTRRYCLIFLNDDNLVVNIKVLSGATLSKYDTTGKLTTKYQANILSKFDNGTTLLSNTDTLQIQKAFQNFDKITSTSPADYPTVSELMPIKNLFDKLKTLEGVQFKSSGKSRTDGDYVQDLVYKCLGYKEYKENGQLPDLMNQLLEIKSQQARTIDLGLFNPNDKQPLQIPAINGYVPTVSDIRYAIFYCENDGKLVTITKIYLVTGQDFFKYFHQFGGKKQNKKIQMHLSPDLWNN